eukprot:TRINITY_DN2712_c0_g1_i1.p1 TRINITY_DN2712_c0_g1~~TRINITY_DN2712_c0_g1_i1.p1  ORF type:complete len:135 (+),score=17.50 TRINITY_DN2712_c0_g1_i1:2-406(+)
MGYIQMKNILLCLLVCIIFLAGIVSSLREQRTTVHEESSSFHTSTKIRKTNKNGKTSSVSLKAWKRAQGNSVNGKGRKIVTSGGEICHCRDDKCECKEKPETRDVIKLGGEEIPSLDEQVETYSYNIHTFYSDC